MNRAIQPRPELTQVPPVVHGGFASTHPSDGLLDFSANINPFGPSPQIWAAMQAVDIGEHPDPRATPLRLALADHTDITAEQLIVGNGAVDLLYQLAVAYLRPGDRVVVVEPTFGEYAAASAMMGAEICALQTRPADDFVVDVAALIDLVHARCPRLLFLCNPNNPTGTYLTADAVEQVLANCPDTLVVLDEAFVGFVASAWPAYLLLDYDNLFVLRSLTKDYALTGLRVGYAVGHPAVIAALEQVQPPWSVNALAQAATLAALRDTDHLQRTLTALARARDDLRHQLAQLCLYPRPSHVHFFLLPVPTAATWAAALLARRLLVRDCTSFGLPTFLRIAPRSSADNTRLVMALAELGGKLCMGTS